MFNLFHAHREDVVIIRFGPPIRIISATYTMAALHILLVVIEMSGTVEAQFRVFLGLPGTYLNLRSIVIGGVNH